MGYWFGDASDPWNPDPDSGNQRDNAAIELGTRLGDIPADAWETTTGTGENTGWFGVVDRKADPRSWDGEEPDWAEPAEWNDGLSGFFAGATQVGGHVTDEASKGTAIGLSSSPKLAILLVVAVLVMLAPYASVAANATE